MDHDLEMPPSKDDNLLNIAAHFARDISAQSRDVSAMMFPAGHRMPPEQMIFAAAAKLQAIVAGIETAVTGTDKTRADGEKPALQSWDLLVQSGFLKDATLIDFVLARHAEDRLNASLVNRAQTSVTEQLPAMLISAADGALADAAQALLVSENLLTSSPQRLYRELPPEYLHLLVWRIVAVLQVISGRRNADHIAGAKALLAAQDESQSGQVAARKIVHFLPPQFRADALDPEKSGLAVFVAALSAETTLAHDHILRLIDGHSLAPFAVLLRCCDLDRDQAMAAICLFKAYDLTPYEVTIFNENYDRLDRDDMMATAARWAAERFASLAIPMGEMGAAR